MKRSEKKKIIAESKEAIKQITHYYKELEKYDPSHIISDWIRSEINRLRSIRNDREIMLLSDRVFGLFVFQVLLLLVLIASFFVQPKIQIDFTLSDVIGVTLTLALSTAIPILLRHFLTKKDRAARRRRDLAEAKNLEKQLKKS